jgi:hypothetical protein
MVYVQSLGDVPTRVLDLLKIFLAASSRGERAVLVLETRSKALTTKYRSVDDDVVGVPAPSTTNNILRKKSPARARRSQLRLETFMKKKSEERAKKEQQQMLDSQAAGATSSSNTSNKLVLELAMHDIRPVGTGLPSPILQVDGEIEEETSKYSFESSYHEEDILYTLREIFPPSEVKLTLESRERIKPLDACHICTVVIKPIATDRKLLWPEMSFVQAQVIENLRII